MKQRYLEVTYRRGRPLAAYLYLPRRAGVKSVRTVDVGNGLLIDYGPTDEPIGIELTAPGLITLHALNDALVQLGQPRLASEDLAPLSSVA